MRFLVLNSEAELHNNGSDKILLLTIEILVRRHAVEVLLPWDGPLVAAIRRHGATCQIMPYPVLSRASLSLMGSVIYAGRLTWSALRLAVYVRRKHIDVVYSNTLSILQGVLLKRLGICRHIWHVHDMIDEPAWVNRGFKWLATVGSDVAMCVSDATAQHLAVSRGRSRVILNGIPPMLPEPLPTRDRKPVVIGVFGRFNRLKGQADMVRAIAVLKSHCAVPFRVRLVGSIYDGNDRYREETRRLIGEHGLQDCIVIEDGTEHIADVYRDTDLLAVPSVRLDPFPTVALEAMSIGIPVVAYRSGGMAEMLDYDEDCLAERGDYWMLALRLQRFVEDPAFRAQKGGELYRRYQDNYTLEHYRARLDGLLDTLPWLHEGGTPPAVSAEALHHHEERS